MTDPVFDLLPYACIALAFALIPVQLTIVAPYGGIGGNIGDRRWTIVAAGHSSRGQREYSQGKRG